MTTDRRAQLIAAIDAEDWTTINALGWQTPLDALGRWWPGSLNAKEARAIVDLHGHRNPGTILKALRRAADQGARFRPRPAELAALIAADQPPKTPTTKGPRYRPDNHPDTLAQVADLLTAGAAVCNCPPGPRTFHQDTTGVIRCPNCRHLEYGQADSALQHQNAHQDLAA
jgi:hypothetical protein